MLSGKNEVDHSSAFTAFLMVNAGIAVGGLFTIATGAYVMVEKSAFEWLSACFIVMGLAMLAAAAIAYHSKDNIPLIRHHVMCSAVLMALEIAFTYAILAKDRYDELIDLPDSEAVRFVPMVCCVFFLISLLTGWCHLRHLQGGQDLSSPLRSSS